MNYIFYYTGKIPKHVFESLNSVLRVEGNPNIILATDQFVKFNDISIINVNDVISDLTKEIKDKVIQNRQGLWSSSMLRVFFLLDVAKKLEISNFIHFDSDVMIYKSFDDVKHLLDISRLNITPLNSKNLVFGYSYVGNLQIYEKICHNIFNIITDKSTYQNQYLDGKELTEMSALNIAKILNPEYFSLLPILPSDNTDMLFDPGSYGQYLGGVYKKYFSKGYKSDNHFIGRKIISSEIQPNFSKKKGPFVESKHKIFELVNLHIHKKNLSKFKI